MSNTEPKKKKSWKNWVIVGLCVVLLCVGGAGVIRNDEVNYAIIEMSAQTMATSLVEEQPKASPVLIMIADVLDDAVAARHGDPKELTDLVNKAVDDCGVRIDTAYVVNVVIKQLNDAYKVSDTEEEYLQKVHHLAKGLRSGAILVEEDEEEEPVIEVDATEPCVA